MVGRSKNKVSVKLLAVTVVLIICTALFSFVGCAKDGADTSKEQTLQSVTIVNKSDFDETLPSAAYKIVDGNVGTSDVKLTIPHYMAMFL